VVLLLASCLTTSGCGSAGVYHRVRPGENLYRIGKAYGVNYKSLARANKINAPYRIEAGSKVYVPGATKQLPVTVITPRSMSSARPSPRRSSSTATAARSTIFSWPVSGKISSPFGKRERGYHDGIDISARRGAPVLASRDGKVIFSDRLSGYGNVVILEHPGGFTSVYAHNDRNLVGKGSRIGKGQKIATIGSTGRADGPHLHFEIRKNNVARNPLYYLPGGSSGTGGAAQ